MTNRMIDTAVNEAIKRSKNSTCYHTHGACAIYTKGPKRGEIFSSSFNNISDRLNHRNLIYTKGL